MNIGEHFYCSRCLKELKTEGICDRCNYNPSQSVDKYALEEGTILNELRFHIGAVRKKLKTGYVYGAYDYFRLKTTYIFEYFPDLSIEREELSGSILSIPENKKSDFEAGKRHLMQNLKHDFNVFEENNTIYIFK